jgi:uncharacterized protein (DUF934 family)
MPLIDRTGQITDGWVRTDSAGADHRIVTLDALPAALAERRNDQRIGVSLANTASPTDVADVLGRLDLIAIAFPAYNDGRGFSLAKRLRRAGFTGKLRAVGPLIADQFAYALACGFDEIELPEPLAARQPAAHWLKAAQSFSAVYQRGYAGKGSILDQRRYATGGQT